MATDLHAGRLRHKVAIKNATNTTDSKGGYTETWATAATVWADIRPMGSNEEFRQKQVDARASHRVILRYNSSLTQKSQVVWGTRVFKIISIKNVDERNEMLDLVCYEEK